jgi:hypothetical protein
MFSSLLTLLGGKPPTHTLSSGAKLRRPPAFPEPLARTDIMAWNMGCKTSDGAGLLGDLFMGSGHGEKTHGKTWRVTMQLRKQSTDLT